MPYCGGTRFVCLGLLWLSIVEVIELTPYIMGSLAGLTLRHYKAVICMLPGQTPDHLVCQAPNMSPPSVISLTLQRYMPSIYAVLANAVMQSFLFGE